ncbi:hypothetical protein OHA72_49170 [Dactylosporangium sp. NBC_01737]|uniref:hypothetical protein n=1 Tax=Dactylosporangium sp. NBC_01737 TaxID=2975959 RepID=UPI002E14E27C|nr:hypothetical protein OHA72_49170 [Dactylosporangium sp. NBC_01737]
MMLLVPADPLRPRRPDEHFAAEADAARAAGLGVAARIRTPRTTPRPPASTCPPSSRSSPRCACRS